MPTYKDIFNLNLKYIEYLLAKTSLTQEYIHNINITGSEIEREVRQLLRNLLPQRFHVTHGYIISAISKEEEPVVSPQVDVIIVDTLVPHSIFIIDQHSGMEVVPIEAVVGIFEVKRTLNRESLLGPLKDIGTEKEEGAIKYLRSICDKVGIRKDNDEKYLPGGIRVDPPFDGGYYSNPLIGIVGVNHTPQIGKNLHKWTAANRKIEFGMVDIVFSLNGYMACLAEKTPEGTFNGRAQTCRQKDKKYNQYISYSHPAYPKTKIVAQAVGFILLYLQSIYGRRLDVNNYFFNKSLF